MAAQCFIKWAHALGLPLLAVAVSVATYLSRRWQVRIARGKLRHDLYDRRFAVYIAFHELLVAVVEKDDVETELRKAIAVRFKARFLLDGLQGYLEELHREAFCINETGKLIRDPNVRVAREPREFSNSSQPLASTR